MTIEKSCTITICRSNTGYLFRVVGRGTLRESPAVRDFVSGAMDDGVDVVMDLSQCEHLDSTFLGCLVILQQRGGPGLFQVYADEPTRHRLFGASHIERVLVFLDRLPDGVGEPVVLHTTYLDREELGQHLLHTHRKLAELGGPCAETFQRVVKRLQEELGKPSS